MKIDIKLDRDFEEAFIKLQDKYGEEFAKLNGLHKSQLNLSSFIDNFIDEDVVADISIDGSSNIHNKDIVTLRSEMSKPHEKLLALNKIFYEFKKEFGLPTAIEWLENEWNRALYLHDANSSTFVAYCFAYDLKRIVEEGLFYLPDHNQPEPAKHLETFVDFVKEFTNFVSNRSSGACGLPNLIPYLWWYWDNDVKNGSFPRNQNGEKFAKSQIQRLIYSLNQPYTRDGIQSAFTNSSIFDGEYFDALFGGMEFPDGKLAIDHKDEILQFEKWFLEEINAIRDSGRMFTFPVNTISLLYKDGKFIDEDFAKWASNENKKWYASNFFCDKDVTSLSNCCRLKSSIKDLGYFNSIGGTALKVGSVKVSTINLARIAYESDKSEEKFIKILRHRIQLDMKALHIVRHIIKRNVEKGLLPTFVDGIMDFEHLYNTVGINGVYEVMKFFGYTNIDEFNNTNYTDNAYRFGEKIFKVCHDEIKQFTKDKDYMVNIEQVPAESAAVRFQQADTYLYQDKVVKDLPLYSNQWIGLGVQASLKDRINICSLFDNYCNGGSICHINVDAPFSTPEQAWNMLNYVTNKGVTYFAFNGKISGDKNNHLFYGDICPQCGERKNAEYTRTVG